MAAQNNCCIVKEVWGFRRDRMAVRSAYEAHDSAGQWFRSFGNELWEFEEQAGCVAGSPASMTRPSARAPAC